MGKTWQYHNLVCVDKLASVFAAHYWNEAVWLLAKKYLETVMSDESDSGKTAMNMIMVFLEYIA